LLKFLRASAEKHVARTNAGKHGAASRFAAQARAGIAPEDRAPLHSAQVEEYLLPMGRGDEQATVAKLRSDLRRLYGEHAETVLSFILRTYRHGGTEALLEAANATAQPAAGGGQAPAAGRQKRPSRQTAARRVFEPVSSVRAAVEHRCVAVGHRKAGGRWQSSRPAKCSARM